MFIIRSLATLFLLTHATAFPRPQPGPNAAPDKTHPELAARTMPLTPPNWTPVINTALSDGQAFGAAGQNTWIVRYPPANALCPVEVTTLKTCNAGGFELCEDERVELEWCLDQMLSYCVGEYVDAVRACLFEDFLGCEGALDTLYLCQAHYTAGPVPTNW
ncbi:hypothetical protein EV426DRAFT_403832 [Tirmania nivea]|nr:hypothetical protein EV426DRAFT_403832 [Tirmania nivea]